MVWGGRPIFRAASRAVSLGDRTPSLRGASGLTIRYLTCCFVALLGPFFAWFSACCSDGGQLFGIESCPYPVGDAGGEAVDFFFGEGVAVFFF